MFRRVWRVVNKLLATSDEVVKKVQASSDLLQNHSQELSQRKDRIAVQTNLIGDELKRQSNELLIQVVSCSTIL